MLLTGIIVVVIAVVAFFGGMKYQQMGSQQSLGNGQRFGNGQGRFGGNGRAQVGQVISIDTAGSNLVIKLQDGSSKIVNLTGQTRVVKTAIASVSDILTGNEIAVFGMANTDGSITASNIQLNPGNGMRGGPQGPSGSMGPQREPTGQPTTQPPGY